MLSLRRSALKIKDFKLLLTNTVRMVSDTSAYNYETLQITSPADHVVNVELNRPEKRNAMNPQFFKDMRTCFQQIGDDPQARVVILSGAGKHFTSARSTIMVLESKDLIGLDIMSYMPNLMPQPDDDVGRRAFQLRRMVGEMQEAFTVIEKCRQPVIVAIHSACVGGGVDMMCSADIRLCTNDTYFEIKEVDIGLAADIGTLQRLPKIIGNQSLIRELAYTARKMYSDEALSAGLVSRVYQDKKTMMQRAVELASEIASKSPVAVATTKLQLNYARDHTVDEGLDYILSWNMGLLQSKDLLVAGQATMQKQKPSFDDMKAKL